MYSRLTVAGQERHVVAKNQVTTYEKTLDLTIFEAKLGMFTVISSPAVEVAGQTMNPIADYSRGSSYILRPSRAVATPQTGQFRPDIRTKIVTRVHKTASQRPGSG
ncbi:hypothetical protein C8039_15470 [Halogeometricum sp. wsp3]|nr:hypothetical protein C8039_15470 [Halogeometricum sp. wsp3]